MKEVVKKEWKRFLNDPNSDQNEFDKVSQLWEATGQYKNSYNADVANSFASFKGRMQEDSSAAKVVSMSRRRTVLRIAAAIIVMVAAGFLLNDFFLSSQSFDQIVYSEDGIKEINLADGSQVWLNKNSSLKFSSQFEGEERVVILEGEAFFDIARDEAQPFIVQAPNCKIKVLGTSFNVRAFENEDFEEVNVTSGRVEVSREGLADKELLLKHDQLRLNLANNETSITRKNALNANVWKTNELILKDNSLAEVFEMMERVFKIEIKTSNEEILKCTYSSKVNCSNLEETVNTLNSSFSNFTVKKISNTEYHVDGNSCH